MSDAHKHFRNAACPYFPCHAKGDPATFNCLFCYCPLYFFRDCGGDYAMRGRIKDCSGCLKPHAPGGWEHVQKRLGEHFRKLRETPSDDAERVGSPDDEHSGRLREGAPSPSGRQDAQTKTRPAEDSEK